eukprot:SAG31_NODE_7109_length_1786_cov_1.452875_1_plen_161_part_00
MLTFIQRPTVFVVPTQWQNFGHAGRPQQGSSCSAYMKKQCAAGSPAQTQALQYGIGYKYTPDFSGGNLTNFEMDLGVFLATRGPYAWLGYGWMGCGCGWEHDGKMPCDIYQRPAILDEDFGAPTGLCAETSEGSGVFTREWTKSTVTVNCVTYTTSIKFK